MAEQPVPTIAQDRAFLDSLASNRLAGYEHDLARRRLDECERLRDEVERLREEIRRLTTAPGTHGTPLPPMMPLTLTTGVQGSTVTFTAHTGQWEKENQ
jgi:hypothetical protein